MFEEIQARIPTLTPWMESCYGTQPFLHLGDHTILSSSGVQQGDPLGQQSPFITWLGSGVLLDARHRIV